MNIVFQGDSITDTGRNRNSGERWNALGAGYPLFTAARILNDFPDREINFYNRGIGGDKVTDLLSRWRRDTINLRPDILTIFVGINDIWHEDLEGNGTDIDTYEECYRMLLKKAYDSNPDIKVILIEPYWAKAGVPHPEWPRLISERSRVIEKLASEFHVTAVVHTQDIIDEALTKRDGFYWTYDGVHPSEAGHQLIADSLIPIIESIMEEKAEIHVEKAPSEPSLEIGIGDLSDKDGKLTPIGISFINNVVIPYMKKNW